MGTDLRPKDGSDGLESLDKKLSIYHVVMGDIIYPVLADERRMADGKIFFFRDEDQVGEFRELEVQAVIKNPPGFLAQDYLNNETGLD